jgi:hypothetical protein
MLLGRQIHLLLQSYLLLSSFPFQYMCHTLYHYFYFIYIKR